jgi:hypothetical protein
VQSTRKYYPISVFYSFPPLSSLFGLKDPVLAPQCTPNSSLTSLWSLCVFHAQRAVSIINSETVVLHWHFWYLLRLGQFHCHCHLHLCCHSPPLSIHLQWPPNQFPQRRQHYRWRPHHFNWSLQIFIEHNVLGDWIAWGSAVLAGRIRRNSGGCRHLHRKWWSAIQHHWRLRQEGLIPLFCGNCW